MCLMFYKSKFFVYLLEFHFISQKLCFQYDLTCIDENMQVTDFLFHNLIKIMI